MPTCTSVCRVCLATDVRMLSISGVLQRVYEKLASTALHADQRPKVVCYICHALLHKAHRLMVRAITAEKALEALTTLYSEVTKSSVLALDRRAAGLCPSLAVSRLEYLDNTQLPGPADVKTELEMENYANGDLEDSEGTEDEWTTEMEGTEKDYSVSAQDDAEKESRPTGAELSTEQLMNNHTNGPSDDGASTDEDSAPPSPSSDEEDDEPADSTMEPREDTEDADAQSNADPSEEVLPCPVCERQFSHTQILQRHMRNTHSSPVYKCDQCEYLCATKDMFVSHLKNHLENNLETPFKRDVCEQQFSRPAVMERQMRNAHSSDSYKCEVCGCRCGSETELKTHTTTQHKKFKCKICERHCADRDELKAHLATHKYRYKCLVCHKEFRVKRILDSHIASHAQKSLTCLVCERQFSKKRILLRHLKTHVSKPPPLHKCHECQRRFLRKGDLDRHYVTKHGGASPFVCDVCKRQFISNNSLQIHLRSHTSEGTRWYNCSDCKRQFLRIGDLERHSITIHAKNPFKCDVCGQQFLSRRGQRRHLKKHTNKYECHICLHRCSQLSHLKKHLLTHGEKPFEVSNKSALDRHMTRHSDESHRCGACQRQFASKDAFLAHMATHEPEDDDEGSQDAPRAPGDKPHQCSLCPMQFSLKIAFRRHVISEHL